MGFLDFHGDQDSHSGLPGYAAVQEEHTVHNPEH
jgi:hypothetical protein